METWTVETNDGGGQLEVHTFRPASAAAIPGSKAPAEPAGVVLVHGTLVTDSLYWPFARTLSVMLGRPVHVYNRRGRGHSAPQPPDYSVETEIADLQAVMEKSGSDDVVAHSYGGFVALQAARRFKINRLVTYDAAVSLSGNLSSRWRPELEEAVTAGPSGPAARSPRRPVPLSNPTCRSARCCPLGCFGEGTGHQHARRRQTRLIHLRRGRRARRTPGDCYRRCVPYSPDLPPLLDRPGQGTW
ncbi:alpha/beta fold hydrolase [Paenarthrobacter sp. RAF9]